MSIFANTEAAHGRLATCRECEHKSMGVCGKCGCLLIAKVRFANAQCPAGKWGEVTGVSRAYDDEGQTTSL
jgi:hypothetical protein